MPLVYTSATLSLAVLELLVHTDPEDLPADLMAVPASLPVKVRRQEVTPSDLPRTWRQYPAPLATQTLGTDWANARKSTVLVVPSAIVPQERNYVLNPAHPDFRRLEVGKAEPFTLDTRLY